MTFISKSVEFIRTLLKIEKCDIPIYLPGLMAVLTTISPYTRKSRIISKPSNCSTTSFSKHITSALTAVDDNVLKYYEAAFINSNVSNFWSIKTPAKSSKNLDNVIFGVLNYLVLTFLTLTLTLILSTAEGT